MTSKNAPKSVTRICSQEVSESDNPDYRPKPKRSPALPVGWTARGWPPPAMDASVIAHAPHMDVTVSLEIRAIMGSFELALELQL